MNVRQLTPILILSVALFSIGCGDGLSSLQGTVTVDGKPAGEGIALQFQPLSEGSPSYAQTDANGNYVAQFTHRKSGIEPGQHRVSLVPGSAGPGGGEQMPDEVGEGMAKMPVASAEAANKRISFPKEYYGEIMTIEVKSGSNSIDIPLKTSGK